MTDIVVRYSFADKAKGPDMDAIAAAAPEAEYALAAIQDLMLGSDPYLVGRDVSFSDMLLAPIIAYFVQFQEGTRAMAKLPKLSHWWLAMQQRPSFRDDGAEDGVSWDDAPDRRRKSDLIRTSKYYFIRYRRFFLRSDKAVLCSFWGYF